MTHNASEPLLPTTSSSNPSYNAAAATSTTNSSTNSSSSNSRASPSALASHLGVAIALTLGLILLNANYSFRNTQIATNEEYQRLASIVLPTTGATNGTAAIDGELGNLILPSPQPEEQQKVQQPEDSTKEEEEKGDHNLSFPEVVFSKSSATAPVDQCPDGGNGPQFTSLRVVDDITQENDVEFIVDVHRAAQFNDVPLPVTTDRFDMDALCKDHKWKFCTNLGAAEDNHRNKLFYTCETRDFVAKVDCAYIDGRERVFGGLVYDHQRRFPVHAAHPTDTSLPANSRYHNIERYKALSHNLAVYPFATAHTFERLPRLFLLIKGLPEDVPVLASDTPLSNGLFEVLDKYNIFPLSRVVWWDPEKIYFADTVYFSGEMGNVPVADPGDRNNSAWNTLRIEHCSWAMSMSRWLIQEAFQPIFWEAERPKPRVVVVNRKDAGSRMLDNHDELMNTLRSSPLFGGSSSIDNNGENEKDGSSSGSDGENTEGSSSSNELDVELIEFVGVEHSVEDTIRLFANADLVIAPHGAALTFTSVMRPGKAVIELGYLGRSGMGWPGNYFHTMVVGSDLRYYLSLADGNYGGALHANVQDVALLAKMALADDKSLRR